MSIRTRIQHTKFESASQEAVVSLLVAGAAVLQRVNDVLATHGITHDQYNVLRILRGAQPDGHPRGEIGKRMISRAPDVTRLIDRLERQGLVVRGWAPDNRRLSIARITDAGLAVLAAADPGLHALQKELTRGLSVAQLRGFTEVCGHMLG